MYVAYKYDISSPPAIFVLGNAWVHVYTTDHSNMASNVKISINQHLCVCTVLEVPNIHPNDCHI